MLFRCLEHQEPTKRVGFITPLNRANLGEKIFRKEGDYAAFEEVFDEAL